MPETTVVKVDRLEVPLIKQLPLNALLNGSVLAEGSSVPQVIVASIGAVIVGNAAGLTVIILDTGAIVLPQASFAAVQVSITVPPQEPGKALKVEAVEVPEISQPPANPLLIGIVLGVRAVPHATVIVASAVIVCAEVCFELSFNVVSLVL